MSKEIQNLELFKEVQAEKFYQKKKDCLRGYIELGRILNDTKEKLPHGDFMNWLEDSRVNFSYRTARRYMKIDKELGDRILSGDFNIDDISLRKAFELASAPEEVKEDIINNSSNSKELEENIKKYQEEKKKAKELEKQLKEQQDKHEKEIRKLEKENKELNEELDNKEPITITKTVEKVVEKKVTPDDYEELKQKVSILQGELDDSEYKRELALREKQKLENRNKELEDNEKFYAQHFENSSKPIDNLISQFCQHQFGDSETTTKELVEVGEFIGEINNIITKISPFMYSDAILKGLRNDNVKNNVENLIDKIERLANDLRGVVQKSSNGEIIININDREDI